MKRHLVERELTPEGPRRTSDARAKRRTVTVNLGESPIAWLHARGHLDDCLFAAGEALRSDYERAQLSANVTMRWDPIRVKTGCGGVPDHSMSPTEKQIAAKQRFDSAIKAAGKGLDDILWRVVCAGEGLPDAERALGWPARSGKLVLKIALERVADFYHIR